MNKIQYFTDLIVWQEAHKLTLSIYKFTKHFPTEEKYALIDQMRRAAVSIGSNIAEGFSRQGKKEKIQFYYMSLGSLTELQNQILVAKDLEYVSVSEFNDLFEQAIKVAKMMNALIRSIKNYA